VSGTRELPAWHRDMSDELSALTMKYARIAQAEGASEREVEMAFLTIFSVRVLHFTPRGFEKREIRLLSEFFDDERPGWRSPE
jgi:hypothetical protein